MFIKRAKNKRKLLGEFPLGDINTIFCLHEIFVILLFL